VDTHELQEETEHAHHAGQKAIGLTMAIVAVLLAGSTLLSHRAHTEEVVLMTKNVDDWQYYQAKHIRAYEYGLAAEIESLLPNGREAALNNLKTSAEEECGGSAEKNCGSPALKKSPFLKQLVQQSKATDAAHGEAESHSGEAQPRAKAGEGASEKHEKGAREGGSKGAVQIQEQANERQTEVLLIQHKANFYDGAELFLEISIVLCSIALLAENRLYWSLSFLTTIAGIAVVVWGLILH
jgi:Domain of unknown function (DUF4337)